MTNNFFKITLPYSEETFIENKGEGIFATACSEIDFNKIHNQFYFGEAYVIARNDSIYYPTLISYGDKLKVKCNGINRATLDKEILLELLKKTDPLENLKKLTLVKKCGNCGKTDIIKYKDNK
ncbi:hypothetical protein VSU16_14540 (plasmid) [Cetobacterium somerae]|uniref:hypothetical protein n=1 Tax=Cetobacterium somerae TaxID=188913 RepID=UPI002E7BFC85|nr:hypothetical protein [Cetobacterium somerae]WVJ03139.1 hypothetical protein VSU16_14540 [Cetobacterium somerae]